MDNNSLQPPITPPPITTPLPEPPKEQPTIQPPINQTVKKVKRFGPKIAIGTLLVALLVGGLVLGKSLTGQKTNVQKQATECTAGQTECRGTTAPCQLWACENGQMVDKHDDCACPAAGPTNPSPSPNGSCQGGYTDCGAVGCCDDSYQECCLTGCKTKGTSCGQGSGNKCTNPETNSSGYYDGCYQQYPGYQYCSVLPGDIQATLRECYRDSDSGLCPNKILGPCVLSSPSSNPSPSPSPSPTLACVSLIKNIAAPQLNNTVTFTCEVNVSSINPAVFFRYSVNGGAFTTSIPTTIDSAIHSVNYNIVIDQAGSWLVQCRTCTNSLATSCTTWGQAN